MASRTLDYSNSQQMKGASARKATDMARPTSQLDGVTLWGTPVGDAAGAKSTVRQPSPRCNHRQNQESQPPARDVRVGAAHNHLQNQETLPVQPRSKVAESRIHQSHLSSTSPIVDRPSRQKITQSRINEGNIVFGASESPARSPPPRVEPFQESQRRGPVRQTLPGFTDAGQKF